jgi:predicted peptidase
MLKNLIFWSLLLPGLCLAQANKFLFRTFTGSSGMVLPYRLFVPVNTVPAQARPLVLALHGYGERGNDNDSQLTKNKLALVWAIDSNQAKFPSFVVAPQCPAGSGSWVHINFQSVGYVLSKTPESNELKTVMELLDSLGREFKLDADRHYVTGLSMGGFGTWDLLMRHPTKFAAAVPICGGADTSKASLLKSLPIWNFHGGADPVVPVANSRLMIAALQKAGGTPKYTEYAGVGHDSWVRALQEPGLLPWLFAQKRPGATRILSDEILTQNNESLTPNKVGPGLPGSDQARAYRIDGKQIDTPYKISGRDSI